MLRIARRTRKPIMQRVLCVQLVRKSSAVPSDLDRVLPQERKMYDCKTLSAVVLTTWARSKCGKLIPI